jgi:hypothetical protein
MFHLLESSFAQTGGIGNTELRQMASTIGQSRDVRCGSIGDVRQSSRHVSCLSDSGHIATAKKKILTGEYLNKHHV